VKDIKAHVNNGKVTTFGVICMLSFRVEDEVPVKAKKKK
jgi:flavin-binding protein dodecin